LPADALRLSVGDPEVADVRMIKPRELYVLGKKSGTTKVMVWTKDGTTTTMDLSVGPDLGQVRAQLQRLMPSEDQLVVDALGDTVVMGGTVRDPASLERLLRMGDVLGEGKKVLNLVRVQTSGPEAPGGLSALLHAGHRAVTIQVNEIGGVAGFALPGNYVDLMVHTRAGGAAPVSKIVLERMLVLALAQDASTVDNKPRLANAVTLEATPQQAEQIDLARSVGTLSLVLRSPSDAAEVRTSGARMQDLFPPAPVPLGSAATVAVSSTAASPIPVPLPVADKPEVIRGIKRTLE
jgi:pilus assembly protein CpaB